MIMAASLFRRKDLFSFYGEIYNYGSFYFLARVLERVTWVLRNGFLIAVWLAS